MDKRQELLDWKETQGLTLTKLAGDLGVSIGYLSHICNGERPIGPAFLWRFTTAYGIDTTNAVFGQTGNGAQ